MDFSDSSILGIDAADLYTEEVAHFSVTTLWNFRLHLLNNFVVQLEEAWFGWFQVVLEFSKPGWMSKVAGSHDFNSFNLAPFMEPRCGELRAGGP